MQLGTEVSLGPGHTVSDGDAAPLPQRCTDPQLSVHACCGQTAGWIKVPLSREVGLGPGHIVLDGDPAPLPQRNTAPLILVHACCGETAGWIKMPLGREVGLGPGHIVLDGDIAFPLPKGHTSPRIFGPCVLWPNGRPSQMAAVRHLVFIMCTFGPPMKSIWWYLSLCRIWLESVH